MQALEEFTYYYDKYFRLISKVSYDIVLQYDTAGDISQEVFTEFFLHIKQCRDFKNVKTWLCKVAKNKSIDYLRKEAHYSTQKIDDMEDKLYRQDRTESVVNKVYIRVLLDDLRKHNQIWYDTYIMYTIAEMKIDEIATRLGCSKQSVKNYLHKSRKYLIKKQQKEGLSLYTTILLIYLVLQHKICN